MWAHINLSQTCFKLCSVVLIHKHVGMHKFSMEKNSAILVFSRICLLKKRKTVKALSLFLHSFVPQRRRKRKAMILLIQSG